MLKAIDLHYNALRQYKRAIRRGDVLAAAHWTIVLDCQLVMMTKTKRLRDLVQAHRTNQKKSKRRNPRVKKRQSA